MEINTINNNKAKKFEGLILPGVTERKDWEQMTVFIAHEDGKVKGMLVAKVEKEEVEIASIAVVADEQRKKIGSELLIYAIRQIGLALYPYVEMVSNVYASISMALPSKEWDAFDAFIRYNGFECVDKSYSYVVKLEELGKSEKISLIESKVRHNAIMSYEEIPGKMLRQFSNKLVQEDIFPAIVNEDYDKDISLFFVKDDEVEACILMSVEEDNSINNEWVYINPKSNDKLMLMELFAECVQRARKIYPDDTDVYFVIANDTGEKLLKNIVPNIKEYSEIREYERRLLNPGEFE